MNKDYSQIDQILDEIILGKSPEGKLSQLISDYNREDLFNELQVHQAAAAIIQRNAVFSQVSRVHNEFMEKRNGFTADDLPYKRHIGIKQYQFRIWWSAAAVLIIAPLLIFLFIYSTNTPSRLFASQYQTFKINVDRSDANGSPDKLTDDYKNGNYTEVIKDYMVARQQGVKEKMIAGFAYMQLKKYDAAVPLFDDVIRNNVITGDRLYQDEAEYYLALSLLKTNELEHAYQLFNKIYVDNEHTFNSRVDKWFMMRLKWLL
jgi:hypothetical protein